MAQGIVIAGTHSGCGKTTVVLGLLAALQKKGLKVQSFKAGPDFIDSGLHKIITGRTSKNLDLWMCREDYVRACYMNNSKGADISVVEGVMGMYDGDYSTAYLASVLDLPVILVIDAYGMAESAGAVVKGFREFRSQGSGIRDQGINGKDQHPELVGVIFNRVASDRHYERLKDSVNGVAVLGYIPRDLDFEIPHRHLGLAVAEEDPITGENLERLANAVLKHIDVEEIAPKIGRAEARKDGKNLTSVTSALKIAVAYDKAFCFYYEDNLDMLRDLGAEITMFSPISDKVIPDRVDCLYLGGGYPELYAEELSRNVSMLESVNDWAMSGRPLYAECGGLMYLSQGIHDFNGGFFRMAGILPFETQMKKGRSRLGYREVVLKEDCIFGKKENVMRGHEFHYSEIIERAEAESPISDDGDSPDSEPVLAKAGNSLRFVRKSGTVPSYKIYSVKDSSGKQLQDEGYAFRNVLASYVHIHFGSNPDIADNFIKFIKEN